MAKRKSFALVSEDTELGRWALTRALEAEGFEVEAVSTWVEASACLLRARFSLALVAVSSTSGNAADIVAYVRQHHPNTRLVLLADQDSISELRLACGPEPDILAKPLDLEEVAHVAHSCPGAGDETLLT
jgi:ActR/RegA family two-component response regulator